MLYYCTQRKGNTNQKNEVMEIYKSKQNIVKELNASVLALTFEPSKRVQKADLYSDVHSCPCLVGHGTCKPIHGKFIETVLIEFE